MTRLTASPAASQAHTVADLHDKIEGLETDLRMAVQVAWRRGAKKWARLNYPGWVEWLEACDRADEERRQESPAASQETC